MPIHSHPILRANEEAAESVGLNVPLDSEGVTRLKNEETAGKRPKVVPVGHVTYFGNKQQTAK